MDVTSFASGMQALKTAFDLTQAVIGLRIGEAAQAQVREIGQKLFDAQQAMFAINEARSELIERVEALKNELVTQKAWAAEKERYELAEIRPGLFAYRLKPAAAGVEPPHHLCADCYNAGKKSLLQGERAKFRGYETLRCGACKAELRYFRDDLPPAPQPTPRQLANPNRR